MNSSRNDNPTSTNLFVGSNSPHTLRQSLSLDESANISTNKLRLTKFFPSKNPQNRRLNNLSTNFYHKDQIN